MVVLSICVLCGLPGCGKTTLSFKIKENSEYATIHICYDKLISWIDQAQTNLKVERRNIVDFVQLLINLCKSDSYELDENIENKLLVNKEAIKLMTQCKTARSSMPELKILFLIDDNMQYSGMRHEYYKLAQNYSTGFSILYVECCLELCKARINEREQEEKRKISLLHSLLRINAQMEIPGCCNWEKNVMKIESKTFSYYHVSNLCVMLNTSFENPLHLIEVNEEEILKIKSININNLKHQSDIILRKIIGSIMKKNKNFNYSVLLEIKTQILNDIKDINVEGYFLDNNILCGDLLNKKVTDLFNAYFNERKEIKV